MPSCVSNTRTWPLLGEMKAIRVPSRLIESPRCCVGNLDEGDASTRQNACPEDFGVAVRVRSGHQVAVRGKSNILAITTHGRQDIEAFAGLRQLLEYIGVNVVIIDLE